MMSGRALLITLLGTVEDVVKKKVMFQQKLVNKLKHIHVHMHFLTTFHLILV
jgi:hypothetical protein